MEVVRGRVNENIVEIYQKIIDACINLLLVVIKKRDKLLTRIEHYFVANIYLIYAQ